MKPKLALETETLRTLTDDALGLVHGGIVSSDNCPSASLPCPPRGSCFGPCPNPGPTFPDPKPVSG